MSTPSLRKLEIGCGQRPSPGYIHNDVNAFEGVDIVGMPWEIDFAENSLDEVLALGVIEHLTYGQVTELRPVFLDNPLGGGCETPSCR